MTGTAVRVGDTVRRTPGAHAALVHALFAHFERVGFGGSPRWGLAAPGLRIQDLARAAAWWAPLRPEKQLMLENAAWMKVNRRELEPWL